jgi:protein-S-isoprenylcysteine O-methyltransferase Ste14
MLKNALSIVGYLIAVAGLLWLFAIKHLFASAPLLIVLQLSSALLMLWARMTFGLRSFHALAKTTEGALVTTGPYRYWRHPIYASILYFVWIGQVEAPSALAICLAVAITLGLLLRMLLEETFLSATYPEYPQYMRRTKRFVPFLL